MPFSRPPLTDLVTRAEKDIETQLPGSDTRLRRSNLNVLARVHSGATHGLYGYLGWIARQVVPDTAEAEVMERHASIWGVVRVAATFAAGSVTFTGTDTTVIPAGTGLASASGVAYETAAEGIIAAGTALVAVTALDAGTDGNAPAAALLSLVGAIPGVSSQATVDASGLTGGVDAESDESLRARLLGRIQQPPHGGAGFDYVAWAREVAGVTRAWVFPLHLGAGTVGVSFVLDEKAGTIIPDAVEVQAVQDYIDGLRPVTAAVTVFAPIAVALDLTIALTPDTAAVRTAVTAQLQDVIDREAEPGATILLSHLREAVSIATGETNHVLSVPAADVVHAATEIAVLGVITWI